MPTTIYPFKPPEIPEPYSESDKEWNISVRVVYCPHCRYSVWSKLAGPKCGKCRSNLIVLLLQNDLDR